VLRVKARKFSQKRESRPSNSDGRARRQRTALLLIFPIEALGLVESLVLSKESS
jgi:hypothetical protein